MNLSERLRTLARYQQQLAASASGLDALPEMSSFGLNPGGLRAFLLPQREGAQGAALVVALHGCSQTAAGFDQGSGWSALARRFGFALLLPQQERRNNPNGCFNWFEPNDIARGAGEAESVREMILHAIGAHGIDPSRVFVTGLSAGGAFANVLLATYPDLFAAGAIVAGLPYAGARSVAEALARMKGAGPALAARDWGNQVRAACGHQGRWPAVSVWQGLADPVVTPQNATDIVRQWLDVHGLNFGHGRRAGSGPAERTVWRDASGRITVELVTLPGFAHAMPLSLADPAEAARVGRAGPYAIEAGISAAFEIARSWGLVKTAATDGPRHNEPAGWLRHLMQATRLGR